MTTTPRRFAAVLTLVVLALPSAAAAGGCPDWTAPAPTPSTEPTTTATTEPTTTVTTTTVTTTTTTEPTTEPTTTTTTTTLAPPTTISGPAIVIPEPTPNGTPEPDACMDADGDGVGTTRWTLMECYTTPEAALWTAVVDGMVLRYEISRAVASELLAALLRWLAR